MGVIEFNADGSFYGGPVGTNPSQTYTYDGAYTVSGSTFQLLYSCGLGCNGAGTFNLQAQPGGATVMLTETFTACTGSRQTLANSVVLTRR